MQLAARNYCLSAADLHGRWRLAFSLRQTEENVAEMHAIFLCPDINDSQSHAPHTFFDGLAIACVFYIWRNSQNICKMQNGGFSGTCALSPTEACTRMCEMWSPWCMTSEKCVWLHMYMCTCMYVHSLWWPEPVLPKPGFRSVRTRPHKFRVLTFWKAIFLVLPNTFLHHFPSLHS